MRPTTYHVVAEGIAGNIYDVRIVEYFTTTNSALFFHLDGTKTVITGVKKIQPLRKDEKPLVYEVKIEDNASGALNKLDGFDDDDFLEGSLSPTPPVKGVIL